ncbi:pimeloyl-ACP methyl ester carboxylesterase [Mucilaginibacter frigoritolerans]|uniref:Pimeloyl-ACP methyl ester carboxylesterase n=1 Tax=Mucilaginibacter frigoritolerans TaxID=652788 RepID=A0A562U569_9SPHI|nr:alpha/beta hydrolase [Mucilaginibacter frigoritolerans]TWJ00884.1 pimeloyl-ACP methyl ester carboxylesterase [Mucilaginibacter frigoritolerans]
MSRIFLIPGLGADTRVYNNIDLKGFDVTRVDWIAPDSTDTLSTYTQKIVSQYNISNNSIIIGNSLGGMIAIEIAKHLPVKKVILISSIKTIDEAPGYFKFFRRFPIYKIIPGKAFTSVDSLVEPLFGHMSKADSWLFRDMLKKSSPVFIKWAMGAVLKWKNKTIPPNVIHITGDRDLVFSYKRIKDAIIVKGGTHIMIFDKAQEINKILKSILN